ncbi:hypothetical protein Pcinc_040241 [Petrolisthes cinctipes]|uniref:Uncharacterized protein n=1 Tax=Petrolisthes cinctipes TaxID=88211 RepID=A0AAE1BPZ8_PETCI|nr:hypothetical protein Pcinc_040241 [Petrolisthes cinctipes]
MRREGKDGRIEKGIEGVEGVEGEGEVRVKEVHHPFPPGLHVIGEVYKPGLTNIFPQLSGCTSSEKEPPLCPVAPYPYQKKMRFYMAIVVVVVVVTALGEVHARYAPTRDHTQDWLALISGKQQFKDARILYSLLNNEQDYASEKGLAGFDSSEKAFEGFQHPFYYHQRQQQAVGRDPVVFSRLSALAPGPSQLLQALPVRRPLLQTPQTPPWRPPSQGMKTSSPEKPK